MNYDLSNITTKERKVSPYIHYGAGQTLRLNSIELVASKNTGSKRAVLHMETEPIKDSDFTPIDNAEGKLGKIGCGVYMKNETQKNEFFMKMKMIADALGLIDEFNQIKGDSFDEVVEKISDLICGPKLFARYTIHGEQYAKADGKIGLRLFLPRWSFVESLSVPQEDSKLMDFDEGNPKHFVRIAKPEASASDNGHDDLPF